MKQNSWFTIFVVALLVLLIAFGVYYVLGTGQETVITVKTLGHKVIRGSDTYLVFTEDMIYENKDTWLKGKINSSDIQNSMEEGKTYRIKYYGWRLRFLSWYPNIYEISLTEEFVSIADASDEILNASSDREALLMFFKSDTSADVNRKALLFRFK